MRHKFTTFALTRTCRWRCPRARSINYTKHQSLLRWYCLTRTLSSITELFWPTIQRMPCPGKSIQRPHVPLGFLRNLLEWICYALIKASQTSLKWWYDLKPLIIEAHPLGQASCSRLVTTIAKTLLEVVSLRTTMTTKVMTCWRLESIFECTMVLL